MKTVLRAAGFADFDKLENMCKELWHETYDGILGAAQVDYMLEKFQSKSAFYRQMRYENYRYFFIDGDSSCAGYAAIAPEKKRLFLSKLYLKKSFRGTGLVKSALEEIFAAARLMGYGEVYLTVNKNNARAVAAYEKYGFKREKSVATDIGNGFVMDDYVYAIEIR